MNRRILIVDDDANNLALLEDVFCREAYEVKTAESGPKALEILNIWHAGLILLDQDMPKMTGLEVLKNIKHRFFDCDVMFISAHTNPLMVSQALEQGADDYLRKPFSIMELISRVHVRFRIRDLREELRRANEKLAELSITDDLTGLYNMRSMYEKIDYEIKRTQRSGKFVSCIMLDMDHFKTVNDGHDHLFGSFVIKEMGNILANTLREVDFAARYGGDEFLIVLIETDENGVKTFCERLRRQVYSHVFKDQKDEIRLTLSIGYALGPAVQDYTARDLVRCADHALYQSKNKGRNQVNGFGPNEVLEYMKSFKKFAS